MKAKLVLLFLVPCLSLSPFVSKAFHIDDTLFLYAARQIRRHPLRPYDFSVNWYGTSRRMWNITKNPPLTSYWLAALGTACGERERPLHVGFWPFAGMAVVAMFWLSARFAKNPWPATLALACCPGFLISATNVMADVPMLSMYLWAVVCFIHGSERGRIGALFLSGVLIGLALVTKYTAMTILPLLAAYAVLKGVRAKRWAVPLAPAAAIFGAWCLHGTAIYGTPHVAGIFGYQWAKRVREGRLVLQTAACMSFFGGCGLVPLLFLLARQWRRRAAACAAVSVAVVLAMSRAIRSVPEFGHSAAWRVTFFVFAAGFGASVLVCFVAFLRGLKEFTPDTRDEAFLWLWLCGVFVFVAIVNWTVAGRFVLLGLPAWFILVSRRAEREIPRRSFKLFAAAGCSAALVVSFLLCQADAIHAHSYREFAQRLAARRDIAGKQVWFTGHWGFQYYMERAGYHMIDNELDQAATCEVLVVPSYCANRYVPPMCLKRDAIVDSYEVWGNGLHVMNQNALAGFYSERGGVLPYSYAPEIPAERFFVSQFWGGGGT